MPTFSPNVGFTLPATGDRNYGPMINGDFSLLDSMPPVGSLFVQTTEVPSTTLNVEISGGLYAGQTGVVGSYAGIASRAMTASSTNYAYVTAAGVLTVNTTGWPTTNHVRLAVVVAGTTTITSITDARVAFQVLGSFAEGANLTFGTATGTQIGTASTQKLGFFGATPVVQPTLGAATAGGTWTSVEQGMLNRLTAMARALGLGS